MKSSETDRIEKQILLRAPRSRVFRALTDAAEFGTWFRAKLEGQFEVGQWIHGRITYEGHEHLTMDVLVERIEPEHYFAFRWHPDAVEPGADYRSEPTTLVEFHLEEVAEGTLLTITESGFEQVPASRRELAFRSNSEGWSIQAENIKQHVSG